LNFDALVHHLEHNLEPRAAEIVGLWLQLVKAEGVDYNAPSGPKAMEDAEREYDELIAYSATHPNEYTRTHQARVVEIAERRERIEKYHESRNREDEPATSATWARLREVKQILDTDPDKYWRERLDKEYQKLLEATTRPDAEPEPDPYADPLPEGEALSDEQQLGERTEQ
jgi:hypothetical protein